MFTFAAQYIYLFILLLILLPQMVPCVLVSAKPVQPHLDNGDGASGDAAINYAHNLPKQQDASNSDHEQVISVRITSSVAVGRGKARPNKVLENKHGTTVSETPQTSPVARALDDIIEEKVTTELSNLAGANIEFIKQLNSRKEARGLQNLEVIPSFPIDVENKYSNESHDSKAESSMTSILEIDSKSIESPDDNIDNVPLARSVPLSPPSKNYIQGLTHKTLSERGNNPRLTTVSLNILHDSPKVPTNYNEPSDTYVNPTPAQPGTQKFYDEPPKFYNEPAKVYSQPAQVYSEPAKFYSEPAKIYSEPAKIYGEPAKIYSEPAKIYSEPAKFYSQPASLHLDRPNGNSNYTPWRHPTQRPFFTDTVVNTTPATMITDPLIEPTTQHIVEHQPEKNYEVDEKISVLTDGRSHGVQDSSNESCKQDNCKVGYVVEGRQYRKYRVEERTSDGYIVGEYGVVRNEDGALRGVRYTADSDASPRLIYDALMKFLQLK